MGHLRPPNSTATATATVAAPPFLGHLISVDATISHYLHTITKPITPRFLLRFLELLADFRFFFPVVLSLFVATPSSSPLRTQLLLPLILCSFLDLLFIGFVKYLVRRSRPLYGNHDDYNAVVSVDNFSFPSGHSSRVSFIATIFYLSQTAIVDAVVHLKAHGDPNVGLIIDRWIGGNETVAANVLIFVVWVWALATAFSRVILGRHFVLDVFVGASCGVLEALFAFHFLKFQF
ncbi:hypothetical protein L6164_028109 [Bauhinia variegata]|uniref:Uncharacterized protein n=1 Tax=Bauhinia variegata TaxID=167791 RepID=A0ACB9LUY4_BAUVA|nr:hypothetical protein L6164_028109 [Bauhinia variegata]